MLASVSFAARSCNDFWILHEGNSFRNSLSMPRGENASIPDNNRQLRCALRPLASYSKMDSNGEMPSSGRQPRTSEVHF
jgi:hypothetical protein